MLEILEHMKLYLIDYFIIVYFMYFFGKKYLKSLLTKFNICNKHNRWKCIECEYFNEF
jgi:hypothetical protein